MSERLIYPKKENDINLGAAGSFVPRKRKVDLHVLPLSSYLGQEPQPTL